MLFIKSMHLLAFLATTNSKSYALFYFSIYNEIFIMLFFFKKYSVKFDYKIILFDCNNDIFSIDFSINIYTV